MQFLRDTQAAHECFCEGEDIRPHAHHSGMCNDVHEGDAATHISTGKHLMSTESLV